MPHLAVVLRRLSATLALVALAVAAMAVSADAATSYGEIGRLTATKGTGNGQFEALEEVAAFGVDPENNSVFVADYPSTNGAFRIQEFTTDGKGNFTYVTSVTFKPKTPGGDEEPDSLEGIAVDPSLHRIYALADEERPQNAKHDADTWNAEDLYAFEISGSKLEPVNPTSEEPGVLANREVFKSQSGTAGVSLLEPTGITVDPTNHDIVIVGKEDTSKTEEAHIETAIERLNSAGAVVGSRYLTEYFGSEGAGSPIVTSTGKVLVAGAVSADEIYEVPEKFESGTTAAPKPVMGINEELEDLVEFPSSTESEFGGDMTIGPEGTIYTDAEITRQLNGKLEGQEYPGILEFSSAGAELGWTGGQSQQSGGGKCWIAFNGSYPQLAAGKEAVFVYNNDAKEPVISEYGPTGTGCAEATASPATASVNGITIGEAEKIPVADTVTFAQTVVQANALSVEWEWGDGSATQTVSADQYQQFEISHKFAKTGTLTITERIHTDDLASPLVTVTRNVTIGSGAPTVVTGEAVVSGKTSATLKGTVNPEGKQVTSCEFEYGTKAPYTSVPCTQSVGSGTTTVQVSAPIEGLSSEHATYHYRLVASNGEVADGSERTFTTGGPVVATEQATGTTSSSATLHATVNPEGATISECYFQYGPTASYGATVPCSPSSLSGSSPVAVSAAVTGLSATTQYDFRIVAVSVAGTEYGQEAKFTTLEEKHTVTQPPVSEEKQPAKVEEKSGVLPSKEVKAVPDATLASSSTTVSSSGAFTLKISCPAGETVCTGTITLKTLKAVVASLAHSAKAKAAILTLASGSFSVSGGQTKAITLHLSGAARTLLARAHVLSARATILAHDTAGSSHTTLVNVTLRPAKKSGKK